MGVHNFSWVIPGKLAGSAIPAGLDFGSTDYTLSDLTELYSVGIRCIVSLLEIPAYFGTLCKQEGISWISYPINDFNVPHDMDTFDKLICSTIENINTELPICAHCYAGIGRTGLFLACTVGKYYSIDGSAAIEMIHENRPAFDTKKQTDFVHKFLNR
jgi:protein-tyrosine phosphatase